MSKSSPAIAGCVLASGTSRRMGGRNKCLTPLADRPMIDWVIERARPQVDRLYINAPEPFGDWPSVADIGAAGRGPLMGLLSAMTRLHEERPDTEWLALFPCDSPFLPGDVVARLHAAAAGAGTPAAVVKYRGALQFTFSLWHNALLQMLREAVMELGLGGFREFLSSSGAAFTELRWPTEPDDPFFSVDTPEDVALAVRRAARKVIK